MLTIQPNVHVILDYTLRDDDGEVLDDSSQEGGEPMTYVHGYGMLVPGLEMALAGLAAGDERDIVVPAEDGYGERDEDLVLTVEPSDFPESVEEGDEFVAESEDGEEMLMRVVGVADDAVVVDANHPLAGRTLHYSVRVRTVRAATPVEIASAAAAVERAEKLRGGAECGEDSELVTLGRKKRDLN